MPYRHRGYDGKAGGSAASSRAVITLGVEIARPLSRLSNQERPHDQRMYCPGKTAWIGLTNDIPGALAVLNGSLKDIEELSQRVLDLPT
nr:hypothetical protein [Cumulibacter soli]